MTHLVYPGALHTRFHHALGAMHLMGLAVETIRSKGHEITEDEEEAVIIAILLHDIGHGPFSHALEHTIVEGISHEHISTLLINNLNKQFNNRLDMALDVFNKRYPKRFLHQLVSGQLDIDRLDYLNRDSFFTGVSEGNINTQRIISMMNVCSEGELVIDAKGVYSIENFLTARMFMYWQVYYHKTSALAEFLLVKILERAKYLISEGMDLPAGENLKYFLNRGKSSATDEDIYRFTQLDDNDIIHAMKSWQDSEDFILSYWCRCVIQRNLPKTVISTHPFKRKFIEEKIKNTNEFFGINNGKELVHEIKRKLLPYDTKKQPIYLLQKNGKKIRLEESQDQLLSGLMVHKTARYILTFPRDISHIIS